jgi:phospholipid/cholesterol/gamma-HCH transport system substrate-binding protein
MKATASQKIRIGIFTILGFVILLAGLFAIGSKQNIFGRTFIVHGVFRNINGLQIGNNVRFAGINAGTVSGITIVNDSSVEITMTIKEKVHPYFKTDATASIGSDGLMGDKLVNISPGPVGNKVLADGGRINTVPPVEFDKIIDRFAHVADNAETITSSLADIATQVKSGKGSIGRLIYSDTLERGLERTVRSAHATINAAHETVITAKKGVEGFQENMEAAKHNFLLRGFFKKKAKAERKAERRNEQQQQQ